MDPALMFEIDAFVVGLLFGSLLNVCIARLPMHESIVRPRSHLPRCGAMIHWYDNIPLLSFVLLRAKCRKCKARIPWRYPLVELGVGIWFLPFAFLLYQSVQVLATPDIPKRFLDGMDHVSF